MSVDAAYYAVLAGLAFAAGTAWAVDVALLCALAVVGGRGRAEPEPRPVQCDHRCPDQPRVKCDRDPGHVGAHVGKMYDGRDTMVWTRGAYGAEYKMRMDCTGNITAEQWAMIRGEGREHE